MIRYKAVGHGELVACGPPVEVVVGEIAVARPDGTADRRRCVNLSRTFDTELGPQVYGWLAPADPSSGAVFSELELMCEAARAFLADLTDLPVGDGRRASELRHRLRMPSRTSLGEALTFVAGLHPTRPGQRALVRVVRWHFLRLDET